MPALRPLPWLRFLWMLALVASPQGPAADVSRDAGAIRTLIAQAEAEGTRDLGKSVTIAQQAHASAVAAGLPDLAADAHLIWADGLLKARKLPEARAELDRLRDTLARDGERNQARYLVLEARWLRDNNRVDEAEQAFVRAAELAVESGDEALLANVLNSHSAMLWRHGRLDRATAQLERALAINLRLGKELDANKNRSYLSLIARDSGDFDRSQALNEEVLASSEKLGDLRGIAVSANTIAQLLALQGEMHQALEYFQRAAAAYASVGEPGGEGPALANVGRALIETGRINEAEAPLRRALALAEASDDPGSEVSSRSGLADLALRRGRIDEAEREATAALAAAERLPSRSPSVKALSVMAGIRVLQKRLPEAIELRRKALQFAREQGRLIDIRDELELLARDIASTGQYAEPYRLQQEITAINSQIRDRDIRRQVAKIEDRYLERQRMAEIQTQAQRIGLLEQQAEQQNAIRQLLAVMLGAALLLLGMLISRVLIRRRAEQLLIERNAAIERANRDLAETADTDILTGSRNRRYFQHRLLPMLRDAGPGDVFALILLDADHFKSINDRFGHDVGDEALIAITEAWRGVIAPGHSLIRWGGEEFLIVAPGIDQIAAAALVARGIAATRSVRVRSQPALTLTVSVGWLNGPWPGADIEALLKLCDRAMLLAKTEGRDRAIGIRPTRAFLGPDAMPNRLDNVEGIELLRT